ncbi:MAG: RraA family protein [Mucilaginibacter sp.]
MKKLLMLLPVFVLSVSAACAQSIGTSPEHIKYLTSEWKGERLPDGRPKVSDALLERLKSVSIEEAWGYLRNKGYANQYEGDWIIVNPDSPMTGRVVTAQYMPARPDLDKQIKEQGIKEGRSQKGWSNSWPIDILTNGDIYVADSYGKVDDGPLIGDNLGTSIYSKSKRGVIFYGSVRDQEGLSEIKGFNGWFKAQHPSFINQMVLTSINLPIRIGKVTVFPGDVVLAKKYGTIFIPSHLVADLVIASEVTVVRDKFGHQRLTEGKYTTGAIDSEWTEEIRKDFLKWLDEHPGELKMTRAELDEYMKKRMW